MGGYYDLLPLPIRRQLTPATAEQRHNQNYAYHVSKAPGIKRFEPWVPNTYVGGENRTVLRVAAALDVLYCFAGNGTAAGSFTRQFYDGGKPIKWTLYRIESEEIYVPSTALVPDADITKEVWVLPRKEGAYKPDIIGELYAIRYNEDMNYYKDHRASIEFAIQIYEGYTAWVDGRQVGAGYYVFTSRGDQVYGLPIGKSRVQEISETRFNELLDSQPSTQEISPDAILERLSYIPERIRKKIRISNRDDLNGDDLLYLSFGRGLKRLVPEYKRTDTSPDGIAQFLPSIEVFRYLELALESIGLPRETNITQWSKDKSPFIHIYSIEYGHVIEVDNPCYKDRWFLIEEPPAFRYYFPVEHAQLILVDHVQRTVQGKAIIDIRILLNVTRDGSIASLNGQRLKEGVYDIRYNAVPDTGLGEGAVITPVDSNTWDAAIKAFGIAGNPVINW